MKTPTSKALATILTIGLLSACGTPSFRKAEGITGANGYGDKETAPGVFWLEYGWANVTQNDTQELELMKGFWSQRAQDLCPNGFTGSGTITSAQDAKIERFFCDQRFCLNWKIIAGKAVCKK